VPDADAQGFVGHAGGRCRDPDLAVAMGRTDNSLAVICQSGGGSLFYEGFGLQNGLPVAVDKVLRFNDGYTVNNIDTQYTITP
jgi:serine/threonine-protein kinase